MSSSSSSALSVTQIAAPDLVGGLERVVQGLAIGLKGRGHDVHVISVVEPESLDHPFPRPMRQEGVTVHEIHVPSKAFLRERREVRELLQDIRPDVVHTHGYRPDLLHGGTARSLSAASVTTAHGSSKLGGKTAFYEWLQGKAFRWFDAVVAVSSPLARALMENGVPERKVHLIPNAWSGGVRFLPRHQAREKLGLDRDETVVAFVGRLIPAKGPDVFAEAICQLEDLPVTALIVGDGPERSKVEEILRKRTGPGRVLMTGHLDEAAPLFEAFDVFVLSSRTEGTPIVLLEALAAGVPTVVTDVGGVSDVVSPEESLLGPPEEPETLAENIRECLADPDAAGERVARAFTRLSSEFSADVWLDRHETLYRHVSKA